MKQTQEFNGKNIDAAIEKACSELNVSKKQLVYDVISSGSSGIFGIVGVKKARIRVTLPEKKAGASSPASDAGDADLQGIMSIVDEAFAEDPPPAPEPVVPSGKKFKASGTKKKTSRKPAPRSEKAAAASPTPRKKPAPTPAPRAKRPAPKVPAQASQTLPPEAEPVSMDQAKPENETQHKKEKGFSGKSEKEPKISPVVPKTDATPVVNKQNQGLLAQAEDKPVMDDRDEGFPPKYVDEIAVDVSETAMELGRKTLQKMVDLMTSDATVVALRDEDRLLLRVEGGNSGVLIGRRGQTLEAMQFLTDKIINRYSESRVRLKVDIEGYMETRKENLRTLAHKMADKAHKTGKPATINQMTAQDRRIVHLALKDDARVRTQSMGDGYYRRLVIFPKKRGYKKKRNTQK
ncbi:RNA-binding cell elongation regulator Jag/EloR [Desulfocicer niacini]